MYDIAIGIQFDEIKLVSAVFGILARKTRDRTGQAVLCGITACGNACIVEGGGDRI